MNLQTLFEQYAEDFERTFVDDNWARLETYFHTNATYTTEGIDQTTFSGRQAVLDALRHNVDSFDRKCDSRQLHTIEGPHVQGHVLTRSWQCEFQLQGANPLVIEGIETATYKDQLIYQLHEALQPDSIAQMQQWLQDYGKKL